jgi:hypothetical protein
MAKMKISGRLAVALAASLAIATSAQAFDLTGLWATNPESCDKIFTTKGEKTSFQDLSDVYGGGLIIEGNHIRGRMATCTIKSRKESGGVIHLVTSCATDIMLQNVQFSVKVVDDNRMTRIFPGVDSMDLDYVRCSAGLIGQRRSPSQQ